MKTLFILAREENIIKSLVSEVKKYPSDLELSGSGELNPENKQNCSFYQPDFIVTGNISYDEAKELLELCVSTNIIIVSDDMNRANDIVDRLSREDIYRIMAVDLNNVSPTDLCKSMIDYQEDKVAEVEDMFNNAISEEELLASNESTEKINTDIDENQQGDITTKEKQLNQFDALENPNDLNNQIEIRDNVKQNSFNLNINNIRSKTISVFSKKGGTGKTNIAKEMCNVFSSVKLPKKLQNGNEFLKACIVDLDFNKGNLRTYLGVENPSPNIYYWINDILDRLENKTSIEKISYNQFQVNGYVKKIEGAGNYYALITSQGGLPLRTMKRIYDMDKDGDLLSKILEIIITSLKRTFDVVIMDCDSDFNDITKIALEKSDNILYVINPTVADIENLKVFTDDVSSVETIDLNKVGVVINKLSKHISFRNELLDVLSLIKFKDINYAAGEEIEKNYPLIADIPYDETIINLNNGYLFTTNNATQETKRGILKICEYCLPIFKIKHTTAGLNELKKQYEKKKKLEQKKKKDASAKDKKQKTIEKLKGVDSTNVQQEEKTPIATDVVDESKLSENEVDSKEKLNAYLNGDLSKVTIESFVSELKSYTCIKHTKTGFPILNRKPESLPKSVWKKFIKQLNKERKASYKISLANKKNSKSKEQ